MPTWFDVLRREIKQSTGVVIDADRAASVASRLSPLARDHGFPDIAQLCLAMMGPRRAQIHRAVVDAMMINETSFFRDRLPFDEFRCKIMPQLLAARAASRSLRIWSAACATGQEAYSLAMMFDEDARLFSGWSIEILATDVSQSAIETARAGVYNQFQVQRGLPVSQLLRYFTRANDTWAIAEHMKSRVRFEQRNILENGPSTGSFDVICCRNLMYYFDSEGKKALLKRLHEALAPDGFLLLGATETPLGVSDEFAVSSHHPWLSARKLDRAQCQIMRPQLRLVRG
jgi:chemotaxis protein methyltransferase CheR